MARDDARRAYPDADTTREPYTRAELRLVCRQALREIATRPAEPPPATAGEPDADEITRRVLATYLEAHCATYGISTILEALADALTVTAREAESEPTGPLAVLVSQIENARAYALLNRL